MARTLNLAPIRWRSMRVRMLLVVSLVAILPVGMVLVLGPDEPWGEELLLRASERAVKQVKTRVAEGEDLVSAMRHVAGGRTAVVAFRHGEVVAEIQVDPWLPLPSPGELEVGILRSFEGKDCVPLASTHVCAAGLVLENGTRVVAYRQARSAFRTLFAKRFQLAQLAASVGLVAVLLGWWLGWRWIRPIETLRREALARIDRPLSAEPIVLRRNDEYGDLAGAFNLLLASVRDRAQQNEAFVADLAHEMKNPLAAIRAATDALAQGPQEEARHDRLVRALSNSSQRLDALVTELLELARAEAGLEESPREALDLGALVQGLVGAYQADPRCDALRIEVEAPSVMVQGVASQIEVALRNLLENAISFAEHEVKVLVVPQQQMVEVFVQDDGPGIDPGDLPRVFDRFYTTRGKSNGTGLGLALTQAIVKAHGGEVQVKSVDNGTRFWVVLPI